MKSKMSLWNAMMIYRDNVEQLESIKKQLYVAAMNNHNMEVDRLRPIIRTYEHDIEVFEQQIIEFDMIQSSSPKEGQQ
ncbi:hypothetical protein [Paenibacillus illinoisensis]|uniref:hypothetical protein n=1 Tax=Paenibacillus illinoisensis TaxID=59845 RepID=UPI003016075D